MLTIAYLANEYPSPVEPYVWSEIQELRRRGIAVLPGSIWRPKQAASGTLYVMPIGLVIGLWAMWLCLWRSDEIKDLLTRILFEGRETLMQRVKALVHTWLGACYALRLKNYQVRHIHVHHGYFAAWVAVVAARLIGASVSMTLHGSDVLQHSTFMDSKLANCRRCFPISEFNRQHILARYSGLDPGKLIVSRLGVSIPRYLPLASTEARANRNLHLLCIGRLHSVKGHPLLIRACSDLHGRGVHLECKVAGDGPERSKLKAQIRQAALESVVTLLGHVPRENLDALYQWSDIVVLTSNSEGIPVVLMEAMARGKIVIAPAITGIPELIRDGETGFLYAPGSMNSFIERVLQARSGLLEEERDRAALCDGNDSQSGASHKLGWMRHAAKAHIRLNFEQQTNLKHFAELLESAAGFPLRSGHENSLLQ